MSTTELLQEVAREMNTNDIHHYAEAISDMGGDYIEFTYNGRRWAAAFGENCCETGDPERDVWGGNSDTLIADGRAEVPFLLFETPIRHTCQDAWLIAQTLIRCVKTAHA